jgi:hypothetical protein
MNLLPVLTDRRQLHVRAVERLIVGEIELE